MANGIDATGANAYTEIIAAPATNKRDSFLMVNCATNDAIVTWDGEETEIHIVAGKEPVVLPVGKITGAVKAKNKTTDSNYTALVASTF